MADKRNSQQSETIARTAVQKKRPRKGLKIAAVTAASTAAVLLVGTLLWGSALMRSETIFPHVVVAGVDVGGMTAEQAQEAVETSVMQTYHTSPIEVQLPDQIITFDPEKLGVSLDAEAAISEAMDFGRSKGSLAAVFRYLGSGDREIPLRSALDMDTAYIQSILTRTAMNVRTSPIHSSMSVNADSTQMEISVGVPGQTLDVDGLYEAVYNAIQNGDFAPVVWDYTEIPCEMVDLDEAHKVLAEQAADAYYDAEKRAIVDAVNGCTFDLEAAKAAMEAAKPGVTVTFDLEQLEPEVTTAKLTYEMFGQKLESRSSKYVNNPKRTENLRLACEAINGTILGPGDVFSFNEIVGERTAEKGYQPATVYSGESGSVEDLGGGICQVASTIYYATLYMDLEQVAREPHMFQVYYVPAGMDATIYWDSKLDYKFRNNRKNPIKIQANVDNGSCNITFWGVKENDNYVEMTSAVLSTTTDEPEEELDETKPVGFRELKQTAYTGAHVVAVQKVFDGDGNLLREGKVYSLYKSRPEIYIVGPSENAPVYPEFPEDSEGGDTLTPWDDPLSDPTNW